MIVTTTPTIEGHRIVAYKGIVVGEALGRASGRMVRAFDEIKSDSESLLRSVKYEALQKLYAQAEQLGANAVIGLSYMAHLGAYFVASATGTAVLIE